MWDLRHVLVAFGAAALLGCGDSGQTGSAACEGNGSCACGLLSNFEEVVVTATISELDEAEHTVVLAVDGVERSAPKVDDAAPGWRVTGYYVTIDLARANDHGGCAESPVPAVGERVLAGFSTSLAGFNCPGCVRDLDCNEFCPPRGAATLHVYDGIALLPLADSYDFAGTILSAPDVIAMSSQQCASLFPERAALPCDDVPGGDDGGGCAIAFADDSAVSSWAWCVAVVAVGATRRRRRGRT